MEDQNLNMQRFTIIVNKKGIKLGRDTFGRLYRIVKSNINIHEGDDEYFCFVQGKKGLLWTNVELIPYEDYLKRIKA